MVYSDIIDAITNLNLQSLSKIILFGSVARGDNTIKSDVDLAIITQAPICSAQRKMITRAVAEFETLESMLDIDCFYSTEEALATANHWSDPRTSIREEGITLWQAERI